jgi:hypothetical protein
MPNIDQVSTLATAPAGSKSPDSITVDNGFIWAAYTNGADSTGASGSSTVVQYDPSGTAVHSYDIPGYVDGLKVNPVTGVVWALQNQDGNSTLSLIDPVSQSVTGPLSYANPSGTRGYDDVVFRDGQVFLSYTNPPGVSGDPTLVRLTNGNNPSGLLQTETVLTNGVSGVNTETGTTQTVPQADPDSLKLAPNGDLLFTSGADGAIIDVQSPGTPNQAVAFTQVQGVTPGNAGLDDVIKPSATAGTFYLSDTKDNRVLAVHATGLNVNDYYASVGSLNAFGQVDPSTGAFNALVSAASAPGFKFGAPHGVEFVADGTANIALLRSFMASSFASTSTGNAAVTAGQPASATTQQAFLTSPHP